MPAATGAMPPAFKVPSRRARVHGIGTKVYPAPKRLVNDDVLKKIIVNCRWSEASIEEVGPGIGIAHHRAPEARRQRLAIERDPDLPAVLATHLTPGATSSPLIEKDALRA